MQCGSAWSTKVPIPRSLPRGKRPMDFSMSEEQRHWRDRVVNFMAKHVYPAVDTYDKQMTGFGANRWQVVPVLEELKGNTRAEGLWNLFMPPSDHDEGDYHGLGLT